MTSHLFDRLGFERHRKFVGRVPERELFSVAISADELPFNVLHVFGAGGVGKTSLLREFEYLCEQAGVEAVYVDGRNVEPSPGSFSEALSEVAGLDTDAAGGSPARRVVLFDAYEELSSLRGWIEGDFLLRLPDDTLLILAGCDPPPEEWRLDPGWREIACLLPLGNLSDEESYEYLSRREVPEDQHGSILEFTHGHPLALSLVADVFDQRPGVRFRPEERPDVIRSLLGHFVRQVPGPAHRAALESCALVRHTTETLLSKMTSIPDVHELFEWLRGLACIEAGPFGLFPHDVAREALARDLHWRNPDWYAELHRRARSYYVDRLKHTRGLEQQRTLFDYGFLHRDNPEIRPFLEWRETGATFPEPMRKDDIPDLIAMVERHEGRDSARHAARWCERQPEGVVIHRGGEGRPAGFVSRVDLCDASPEEIEMDPATRSAWRYLEKHAPLRSGEQATLFRFWMARETYQEVSAIQSLIFANVAQHYLTTPRLAFTLFPVADPEFWTRAFAYLDLTRLEEAAFEVDGRRYGVYGHDWRQRPPTAWLDLLAEREVSLEPLAASGTTAPVAVLGEEEFASAVRDALKNLRRPGALHRNPLLRSRLVSEHSEEDRLSKLKAEISAAIASLKDSPRDAKLHRALHHTFVQPAPTQEQAARLLDLPFSTYRRHLKAGTKRVADILWEKEIGG